MLYDEFLAGTKAEQSVETYRQFELFNQIYMDCNAVSKEDIYRIWKQTYGKQLKDTRKRMLDYVQDLANYRDCDNPTPVQRSIREALIMAARQVMDLNEFRAGFTAQLTADNGITYMMQDFTIINGHRQARLWIAYAGKWHQTALVYGFGDIRICRAGEDD